MRLQLLNVVIGLSLALLVVGSSVGNGWLPLEQDGGWGGDALAAGGAQKEDKFAFGDMFCDGDIGALDGLMIGRFVAGMPSQLPVGDPCPGPAGIGGMMASGIFGDVDCSGGIDVLDFLTLLRSVAGLPYKQHQPCPAIGSLVVL